MIFANRMSIFTVHIRPGDAFLDQKPIFLKEGFNFIAFLFPLFWGLYQRLWWLALAILAMEIGLVMLASSQFLSAMSLAVIKLAVHTYVGFASNDLVRARLSRRGYVLADITVGDSLLRAEQRYFERCLAAGAAV